MNLDIFRQNLDKLSYSAKCLLGEMRLDKKSLDKVSFRRNAFRRNVIDPIKSSFYHEILTFNICFTELLSVLC